MLLSRIALISCDTQVILCFLLSHCSCVFVLWRSCLCENIPVSLAAYRKAALIFFSISWKHVDTQILYAFTASYYGVCRDIFSFPSVQQVIIQKASVILSFTSGIRQHMYSMNSDVGGSKESIKVRKTPVLERAYSYAWLEPGVRICLHSGLSK